MLLIFVYYQANQPHFDKKSYDSLIQDLKRQVQHYQGLYQRRVEKDLDKKDAGTQMDISLSDKETQTDLSDKQITNLITQWNQVAEWATEIGIDVNQRWNLGMVKGKLQQNQAQEKNQFAQNIQQLNKQIEGLTILADKRKQDLEREKQALIDLAKQKIANKKEASELLKELEQKWQKDKEEWEEEKKWEEEKTKILTENYERQKQKSVSGYNDFKEKLKQDLFIQGQETYQKLKKMIKEARFLFGEEEVEEKIKELDKYFTGDYPVPQPQPSQSENNHQEQLRKINLLFDPSAANDENIDFDELYKLLWQIAMDRERERERERNNDQKGVIAGGQREQIEECPETDQKKTNDEEDSLGNIEVSPPPPPILSRKQRRKLKKGKK